MRSIACGILLLATAAAIAPAQSCPAGATVAFVGADVLTMKDTVLLRRQTVVVRGGRIVSIDAKQPPAGACRIDARGRVLLPGLADLHAHLTERDLPLLLSNGITTVREMNGSPAHIALRRRIDVGELPGPRLVVASTLLAGTPLRYRHRIIRDATDARKAAEEAKAAGYEFLKVYDGLTREAYDALSEASRALALPLDGHVPEAVGLQAVLEAGQAIQHMDKIAVALSRSGTDTARLSEARRLFTGRRAWVTPTLASLRVLDRAGTAEYAARFERPEMAYVDSETIAWWRSLIRSGTRPAADSPIYRFQIALLRVLKEAGTRFLLGTDAANPLMIAGFSAHEELETLVRDGGFSRFEALLTATRNAAEFLGDSTGGRVQPGARADLLLVDANPLAGLEVLVRPRGVMVGGRWLDRARLDSLVATRQESPPTSR